MEFAQADAQVHDFGTAAYDLIVSRTGTMFFGDAAAAFANLATATRPGGRLAILVWRGLAENQWLREIFEALRVGSRSADATAGRARAVRPERPGHRRAIAGRRGLVRRRLRAASTSRSGWAATLIREPGGSWASPAWLLRGTNEAQRAAAAANLHALFAAHQTPDGVELGSAAWLITARRAP